ncbi:protein FAM19A5 isoform X1 [Tupaia chinensis]|uniref:protein FAM19A5 isoform X1 n=1 Tax=Tupaia chinensis TaxID=246437 RepID=UPI000FFC26CC|nr:protein FAM19A5 isoform X1 [Tupaia chinensis]
MQLLKALWALAGAALCCFLVLVIHAQFLKEGQLAAGTCEIVTLDRDSSQPRRTIARQTARCACRKGQIAGTTRARPACVDEHLTRRPPQPVRTAGEPRLRGVLPITCAPGGAGPGPKMSSPRRARVRHGGLGGEGNVGFTAHMQHSLP